MNFDKFELKVTYSVNGVKKVARADNEDFQIVRSFDGVSFKLSLIPNKKIDMLDIGLYSEYDYAEDARSYVNGYQSWTTSKEYTVDEKQPNLFPLKIRAFKEMAGNTGDYFFTRYYGKGIFHSFSYGYVRNNESNVIDFVGSLSERQGYTIIYYNMQGGAISVEKDVEGLSIESEYEFYNLVTYTDNYDVCFDKYFEAMNVPKLKTTHLAGYTSWYNYMQDINEEIILRDLEGLSAVAKDKANIFQIDDGTESMVGDWHVLNSQKFPNGLRPIVDKIHSKGYKAGLWLAPFSAQLKAQVIKDHPDWLIKNTHGKLEYAGMAWGGFYALDMYNEEVRKYIKGVFDEVFDDFGFDMVKLDFLYCECMFPRYNKTRGQIMCEAMDFLRECCRDKLILGCGVPLAPAFGKVDACRISCDVELSYKDKFYVKCTNQEIISARNAMNNSIFRRHLNKRVFLNDPDVFFLRYDGRRKAKFTKTQKELLAKVNNMCGNVLFVSDNCGNYDEWQKDMLLKSLAPFEGKIDMATYVDKTHIAIEYTVNGAMKVLVYDTVTGDYKIVEK